MEIKSSKYPHGLKAWELHIIKDYASTLSAKQLSKLLGRQLATIYEAAKKLKVKCTNSHFQMGEPEMPNIEEYKSLFQD